MKRVILGAAAAVAAAATAVAVPSVAGATGSGGGGTGDSVYIAPTADYNTSGFSLDLDLVVKCSGGLTGVVNGSVTQSPPETPSPVTFSTGNTLVVCDGQSHTVAITVDGAGYDDGYAKATMTLVNPNTLKSTTATAKIYITAH